MLMVLMISFLVVTSNFPAVFSLSCSRLLYGHFTSGIGVVVASDLPTCSIVCHTYSGKVIIRIA